MLDEVARKYAGKPMHEMTMADYQALEGIKARRDSRDSPTAARERDDEGTSTNRERLDLSNG